jgi:F420-non-reducing hydrogenase large subunit
MAHHAASCKAADAAFKADPSSAAKKLREMVYSAYMAGDHTLHLYYLGGPDYIVGPTAPPAERNVLGVIGKVGLEIGAEVIKHRAYGQKIQEMVMGFGIHPMGGIPGGVAKALTEESRAEIQEMADSFVEFAKFTQKAFHDLVFDREEYHDLLFSDELILDCYHMGLVDENNHVNFYDGDVRVTGPDGTEFCKFKPNDYVTVIGEHVEPWTYVKLTYLNDVGWKGLADGPDSGLYRVGPQGRLNAADGMATPLAQEEYERFYEAFGERPVKSILAHHWARMIEQMYAAERLAELIRDPEITDPNVRTAPGEPGEGVGIVEAARGTLIHHYKLDDNGIVDRANMIVATTNNAAAINLSVKRAAHAFIHKGEVDDGILNQVEMAFRAYDPCYACATHSLPGTAPLEVTIHDHTGETIRRYSRER